MAGIIIGVVCAVAGIAVSVLLFLKSASKRQAERLEVKVDVLSRRFGQLQTYLAELPASRGAVRVGFSAGLDAMEAYKWDEAIGHFKAALKTAQGTQLVALYNLIGLCHFSPGRREESLAAWEESRRLARDFGDRTGEVRATGNMGLVWHLVGEWDRALEQFSATLALHRELGDRLGEAKDLGNIGAVWKNRGDLDKALESHTAALRIFVEFGAKREQAGVLSNIGLAWQARGDLDKALGFHEQSLKLRREAGDDRGEGIALANIGTAWQLKGQLDKALGFHERALEIATRLGTKQEQASVLGNIGLVWLEKTEPDRAVAFLLQARGIFEQLGARAGVAHASELLGRCLAAMGRERFVAACVKAGMPKTEAEKLAEELGRSASPQSQVHSP